MAVQLPNGVIISLGTTLGSPISITGLSNANPAVATASSHGLSDGDIGIVTSGWVDVNERVYKVDELSAGTFSLVGQNTTDTDRYPAGTGTGTFTEVTAWTQITQITGQNTSGGDMQFAQYSFLESRRQTQLPTEASPMTITLEIADDPSLAGYQALDAAADSRDPYALRFSMPDGSKIYLYGYISFNKVPVMNKGQIMTVKATFSLLNEPTRYTS